MMMATCSAASTGTLNQPGAAKGVSPASRAGAPGRAKGFIGILFDDGVREPRQAAAAAASPQRTSSLSMRSTSGP